jgi:integrase
MSAGRSSKASYRDARSSSTAAMRRSKGGGSPDGVLEFLPAFETRRVWSPAVEASGFQGLTFHGLRHSAAGVTRLAGASDQVVQHRMRHSHRATTSDIYGWTPDAMDALAIDALERLWQEQDGTYVARGGRTTTS